MKANHAHLFYSMALVSGRIVEEGVLVCKRVFETVAPVYESRLAGDGAYRKAQTAQLM